MSDEIETVSEQHEQQIFLCCGHATNVSHQRGDRTIVCEECHLPSTIRAERAQITYTVRPTNRISPGMGDTYA